MKAILAGFSLLILAVGCGSTNNNRDDASSNREQGTGNNLNSGDFSELQNNPPTQVASLISAYGYQPTSQAAAFVGFYTGNRYLSGAIQLVGRNVYRMQASAGYYSQGSGIITTTPKKITCPGVTPRGAISGSDHADSLVVTVGSTTTVLSKIAVTSPPPNGLVIQWGCFDRTTGAFTQHAWADLP
jgi:hypothetical protein